MVVKKLLEEIIPRYGTPVLIGSDNGPAFAAQVAQGTVKALGEDWKLQCADGPQSSGQVESMNWTLKDTLAKLIVETCGDRVAFLPFTLYRVWHSPYMLGLTAFGIVFGWPPSLLPNLQSACSQSSVTLTCLPP